MIVSFYVPPQYVYNGILKKYYLFFKYQRVLVALDILLSFDAAVLGMQNLEDIFCSFYISGFTWTLNQTAGLKY